MQIRFDTPAEPNKNWFRHPSDVISAVPIDEVQGVLSEIQEQRARGKWIAGFASYELGYALEPKLHSLMPANRRLPLLQFGIFDGPSAEQERPARHYRLGAFAPQWTSERYQFAFDAVINYIKAGDIYQANLTFGLEAEFQGDAWSLYSALNQMQPVKHGAYLELESGQSILSRSPELFFRTSPTGEIATRPMKGTQPRDQDPEKDAQRKRFLEHDVKNRAENLMIVDLLRNDISRICKVGSVKVPELYKVETYTTVHQMTSLVTGQLSGEVSFRDILTALHPCGSITGAPKVRAMEIIRDLEQGPRDIYCGTLGWMAPDGRSEFNVAIRTITIDGDKARLNVGGGVVYDSTADAEYEEALWKARFAQISQPVPS